MSLLEGFRPKSHDEGHFLIGDPPGSAEFFRNAHPYLEGLVKPLFNEIVPKLDQLPGKWHPLGFMVFHLGVDERGQSLRLHIWPQTDRFTSTRGPHIHNHAWDLASRVVAGTYTDKIVKVSVAMHNPDDEEVALRPYRLTYKSEGLDTFETDGTGVTVDVLESRRKVVGEGHEIKHGVFHVPRISPNQLTATLVLDAPSRGFDTTVLITGRKMPFEAQRRKVTGHEARKITDQLLNL